MSDSRGQSMLEAIIAAGIIVTAVTSSLTLVSASVGAEKESEGAIIGAGLAREGIEAARSLRDDNWLADDPWDDGLEGSGNDYIGVPVFTPTDGSWSILFSPSTLADAETVVHRYTTAATPQETVGLFVQAASPPAGTVPTSYRRLLALNAICDDDLDTPRTSGACTGTKVGIQAISEVQWTTGGRTRRIVMEERMFDWR
jgi:Tfp pilus assembly protein PilV